MPQPEPAVRNEPLAIRDILLFSGHSRAASGAEGGFESQADGSAPRPTRRAEGRAAMGALPRGHAPGSATTSARRIGIIESDDVLVGGKPQPFRHRIVVGGKLGL